MWVCPYVCPAQLVSSKQRFAEMVNTEIVDIGERAQIKVLNLRLRMGVRIQVKMSSQCLLYKKLPSSFSWKRDVGLGFGA
jgi:hypothetical protein